jgi:hypothetical protein
MMIRASSTVVALVCGAIFAATLQAQQPRVYDENGIRYQETTQVIQRLIPETRYEQRENTVFRPKYTTDMHDSVRTYQVPITQQQWVPGYQRTWNIFAPPVLSYRLLPVTRWETRTETVRVPVTKCEYIPEKQVQQVPITNTRLAEERIVRRVPIGTTAGGTAVARNESTTSTADASQESNPPSTSPFGQIDRRK